MQGMWERLTVLRERLRTVWRTQPWDADVDLLHQIVSAVPYGEKVHAADVCAEVLKTCDNHLAWRSALLERMDDSIDVMAQTHEWRIINNRVSAALSRIANMDTRVVTVVRIKRLEAQQRILTQRAAELEQLLLHTYAF